MKTEFGRIAIIGIGLIGGSILRDLKEIGGPSISLYGIDTDPSAAYAKSKGLIKSILTYDQLVKETIELIIISSPIDTVPHIARELHVAYSHQGSLAKVTVMDVASVKKHITSVFENLTNDSIEFVATHPMAGTEFSGLDHARLRLFRGKPWIITPHAKNSKEALIKIEGFIHLLGGRIKELDASTHDTYAAAVSHSTILLSNYIFDFLSGYYPEALDLAGSGFDSTTRLASGNPELHKSIMHNNAESVDKIVKEFYNFLKDKNSVKHLSDEYFSRNKVKRDEWLSKKTIVAPQDESK